ncbi:amino acid ABC transporter substrate-binding protein [Marinobacter nanhaiticus D15-8W]|uniref:Amino acid ABC transporter substrate-binding protein n=1 Tax=Marinobacter nanhaiticus D15-8W TaxID=626887 RepID=N6W2Q3_9GAMM|nr:amino acid ABC transporter substrate-binding protein [Marinobacter nanhaiticus D15-8W]
MHTPARWPTPRRRNVARPRVFCFLGRLFMLRTLLLISATGLFLLLGSASATFAAEAPVLRLNVSPQGYPPYTIVEGQETSGIIWDVAQRITERLGYRLEAYKIPRKRVDDMLLEDYVDATARAKEWTDRPERFVFTDPIVRVREVFFTLGEDKFVYDGPDDIGGKTILTHLGYKYPYLLKMFESKRAHRFDVPQDKDIFSYLLHGDDNFDLAIADKLVGQWIIRKNGWRGKFSASDKALTDFGLRLMLRPEMNGFAKKFNAELATMKSSGELDRIMDAYR